LEPIGRQGRPPLAQPPVPALRLRPRALKRRRPVSFSLGPTVWTMPVNIPFRILIGKELNTVAFVMDYVEFHFNGPRIRALTNPIVRTPKGTFQFPFQGSRDELCSLIGHVVRDIVLRDGHSLEISFSSNTLTVPLDPKSYLGSEALHWHPDNDNKNMVVW